MKAFPTLTLALAVAAAGCGSTPSTPDPPGGGSNTTATTTYRLDLRPEYEKPNPVSNAEASGSGAATIALRVTRDPNNAIVGATADFAVNVQGFPDGSTITAAHIHPGDASTTGTIIVDTGLAAGEAALSNGAASFQKTGRVVSADLAQGILNAPENYYFNVHSAMNPGGVVRAQLNNTGGAEDPGPKPPDPEDPYYPPVPDSTR